MGVRHSHDVRFGELCYGFWSIEKKCGKSK